MKCFKMQVCLYLFQVWVRLDNVPDALPVAASSSSSSESGIVIVELSAAANYRNRKNK